MTSVRVRINFTDITYSEHDGFPWLQPYIWTVFFKVDGDTVAIGEPGLEQVPPDYSLQLQGHATVIGTPGCKGDLSQVTTDTQNLTIPSDTGDFSTILTPIPCRAPGCEGTPPIAGYVGAVVVILGSANGGTPADAVAKGHQALNTSLQQQLDALIPQFGLGDGRNFTGLTAAQVQAIQDQVQSAVQNAISGAISTWDKILTALQIEVQDTLIGAANFIFTSDDSSNSAQSLINLPANGVTLTPNYFWQLAGEAVLNGKIIADPLPLSMKRILTGLGYSPPVRLSEAIKRSAFPEFKSILSWIASARYGV